jgi:class 3 adenylate cyclase/tetratricopeptide (TPR) repeat protein
MQKIIRLPQETLLTYLPGTLVDSWARRPDQSPIWGHWLSGSLMHCDISGFTAMSESLAALGKEGAELMAGVLNRFFDTMLEVADRWGGVQMKFGGDAMLLFFSGREHAASAAACGLEMQKEMAGFRRVMAGGQEHRLRMRAGIHSGRFFAASVGNRDGTLHYLLLGPDVNRTAAVEPIAGPDQVVVSAETAALLGPQHHLAGTAQRGVWRVRSIEAPPVPQENPTPPNAPVDVLRRYLMPPLAEGRVTTVSGEHRRVTALFINLLGASSLLETEGDGQALAQVDTYVKLLMAVLERNGGFLAASDVAEDGDKLIALFGAPVSHEREEAAAVRSAWELQAELKTSDLSLRQRIGINSGFVFAGEIGSRRRREYTVIGDSVNLAARLMAAARPGQVLVSADTAARAGAEFDLRRSRPIRVKGKSAPVTMFRLEGARDVQRPIEARDETPLVGREPETRALLTLSRQVARGRGGWAYVWGDAGMGKSHLILDFVARLRSDGWRTLAGFSQAHTSRTPFAPWVELLRTLFGIVASDTPQEAWDKLKLEVERLRPDLAQFAPLLGNLLSLGSGQDAALSSLDAKTQRDRLTETVVGVLQAAAGEQPTLLLFEDLHWMDGPSLEFLSSVLGRTDSPFLVCLTSRNEARPAEFSGLRPSLSLRVGELPPEAAHHLLSSAAGLANSELDAIVARAQGNPLFLREIARSGAFREGALPETINDVIMARLDRLGAEEKTVLRSASVIGPTFDLRVLRAVLADRPEVRDLERSLGELTALGFLNPRDGDPYAYAFHHVLAREVAYETILYAQRRRLHHDIAACIEGDRAGQIESVCELLLHHFELAGDAEKTVLYGAMSADRAASIFANQEAVSYYDRSLSALEKARRSTPADRSLLLEHLADCQDTAGRYREAAGTFAEALETWRRTGPRRPRLVPWPADRRTREAALCRKVAVCLERSSDYDESLRWVERALAALPRRGGRVGAEVYLTRSMSLFRKGLYEEAIRWGRQGLALSRHSDDLRQIAYAHHVLAGSYMELGKLRQAIHHDRWAVRFYHQVGDYPGQAMANSNLGACYQLQGVLDAALYHYQVALKADEHTGNVAHTAIVHNNIGEVLLVMGQLEEAAAHLEEVTRLYRLETGLAAVTGLAHVNISRCRLRQSDLDSSEVHLSRGVRLLRRVGAEGLLVEARLQLAELRLVQGRAEEARRRCRRALTQARGIEARLLEARAQRIMAGALALLGDTDAARTCVKSSVSLAHRIGAGHEEALSLMARARIELGVASSGRGGVRRALSRAITILARMDARLDLEEAHRLLATMD